MRVLAPLLLVLACAMSASAEEAAPSERAFVELSVDNATPYVGQPFVVRLRVGIDRAWFEAHAVPLFRQPMEVPVQVDAPWLRSLPGTRDPLLPAGSEEGAGVGSSFVLNDQVVRSTPLSEVVRDGRRFGVFEVRRSYEATGAGPLELPAPSLRFAHATKFEDDFVGGRVAIDRLDETVRGQALSMRVRPLPESGRPAHFGGAVGRFEVQAKLDESRFATDGILRLHLELRGDGNLWTFPPPRLPLAGFHLYGATESRRPGVRTITYELTPTSPEVSALPAIAFPFFDPTPPGTYRLVRTQPLPLSVRLADQPGVPADDPAGTSSSWAGPAEESLWHRFRVCLGMLLAALCLGLYVRRRQAALPARLGAPDGQTPADALQAERLRSAQASLRAALDGSAAADAHPACLVERLVEYLALQLAVAPAVVVAPDLESRLLGAGVPSDLARRTAMVLAQHVAARYGAPAPREAYVLDTALLDALQEAFESAG